MNKKLKWTIGFLVAAMAIGLVARYCGGCRDDVRTIAVTGECLTTAPKDRTAITLRVVALNQSAAASMRAATTQVAEITSFLKDMDVKMQTTQFNSYEKTEWDRNAQKSISLGIETTIAIEVSADNIETIETVLNQFAGRANVYPENLRMFTSSEAMKPILEECLGTAVENARMRANALAAGDGRRAGRVLAISYGAGGDVIRPMANFKRFAATMETAAAMDTGGSLVARDTEVSVTVSAVFEIK